MPYNVRRTQVRNRHHTLFMKTHDRSFSVDYTWIDSNSRQVKLPAPTYIDYVVTWVQKTLDDENVFPTKAGRCFSADKVTVLIWTFAGREFPPNFPKTVKHIYRQLLRVFAHLYHAHYHQLL